MEILLGFFSLYTVQIITALVIGIGLLLFMLLIFPSKQPENIVQQEFGGSGEKITTSSIEGALRRVLGEGRWQQASTQADAEAMTGAAVEASAGQEDLQRLADLEQEILEKDRKIAELLKQGGGGVRNDSELLSQIADLQAQLKEYEIIEEDLNDLSVYKSENQELRKEIARLKGSSGEADVEAEPTEEAEQSTGEAALETESAAPEPPAATPETTAPGDAKQEEPREVGSEPKEKGPQLVAEFETVVNNQYDVEKEEHGRLSIAPESEEPTPAPAPTARSGQEAKSYAADIEPDSKEEAEMFIKDLKGLQDMESSGSEQGQAENQDKAEGESH